MGRSFFDLAPRRLATGGVPSLGREPAGVLRDFEELEAPNVRARLRPAPPFQIVLDPSKAGYVPIRVDRQHPYNPLKSKRFMGQLNKEGVHLNIASIGYTKKISFDI